MASNNPWANLLNPNAIQSPAAGKGMLAMNKPAGIGPDGTDFYLQQGPGGQVQSTTAPSPQQSPPQNQPSPIAQKPQFQIPHFGPSQSRDQREIESQVQGDIDKRGQGVADYQDQLSKLGERPDALQNANFSPLAAFVDSITGSKIAQGVHAPSAKADYDNRKMLLQQALEKNQGGLTDDRLKLLKIKSDQDAKDQLIQEKLAAMMNGGQGAGVGAWREKSLGLKAAGAVSNDPIIKDQLSRQYQMQKDLQLLNSNAVITPQKWDEIQQGIAQGLSGGRAATVDSIKHQRMDSIETGLAGLQQRLANRPTDINSPDFKKDAIDTLSRLHDMGNDIANERAEQILGGIDPIGSSVMSAAAHGAASGLKRKNPPQVSSLPQQAPSPQQGLSENDQVAIDYAMKNPNDPMSAKIKALHGIK